ncbi:MAG TPA: hydroxyacid dehydrogenase [Candidatus Acidoferrales bacterium]|nr:hydroxyacid dehydrogenase [Candidatus Acidoferrales bacterium]
MKVLACDRVDAAAIEMLRTAGHEVSEGNALKGADLVAALAGVDGLLVRGATRVTADVFAGAPTLRVVVRAGTGLDNVDRRAAQAHGVRVLNTPNANSVSVAELVFGLLLALERHLVPAVADLRRGVWEKTKYQGRELSGRTLGILGFGRIGREVATRARAFDMPVLAHDPLYSATNEGFAWVRAVPRDELLRGADVVTLHVPLTDETHGSFGAREFALMKRDAVLVNCSRGGVVNEAALLDALRSGTIRGAATDVFEHEPPGQSPLLELPNLLALPHLGASTAEAQRRAGTEAAQLLIEALAAAR